MRCSQSATTGVTPDKTDVLTAQYSVRFLFIDRRHSTVDASVLSLGHVVFTNAAAIILAVGQRQG
jgi:hypothetical protein